MTPQTPQAALAEALAQTFGDASYHDRPDEFMGEAGVYVRRLAAAGYVIVPMGMLRMATTLLPDGQVKQDVLAAIAAPAAEPEGEGA